MPVPPAPAGVVRSLHLRVVRDLGRLTSPLADDLRTSSSLTHEPWMRCGAPMGPEQQHVAGADQSLGAGLVEDHTAVGHRGHGEREPSRNVGLDDTGDHVDRRSLRRDHEMNADGARHLRDATDRILDVAGRDHHEVGELVDHDEDERQPGVLAVLSGFRHQLAPVVPALYPVMSRKPTSASRS